MNLRPSLLVLAILLFYCSQHTASPLKANPGDIAIDEICRTTSGADAAALSIFERIRSEYGTRDNWAVFVTDADNPWSSHAGSAFWDQFFGVVGLNNKVEWTDTGCSHDIHVMRNPKRDACSDNLKTRAKLDFHEQSQRARSVQDLKNRLQSKSLAWSDFVVLKDGKVTGVDSGLEWTSNDCLFQVWANGYYIFAMLSDEY